MTKKKTSYQKLKDQNAEMLKDIYILVDRSNFLSTSEVMHKYRFIKEKEIAFWQGTKTKQL